MKLLYFLAISSLIIVSSESFFLVPLPFHKFFVGILLKTDEPIPNNETLIMVDIKNATGSIGAKTFSLIPDLSTLTIASSNISHIEDNALCTPKLEDLTIEYNEHFPKLTKALLSNCNKLKLLRLKDVEIDPDAFNYMVNLERITLEGLRDFHLTKDYLEPLKNLKSLGLINSEIKQIDGGIICSSTILEEIYITGNTILPLLMKTIFEGCNNVRKLTFTGNQEVHIDEDVFTGFDKVTSVRIHNLDIKHLSKKFLIGFKGSEILDISHSNITEIDDDTFTSFSNLENLSLDENELTEFKFNVNLNRLRSLSIAGNKITEVNSDVLSHFPNLQYLDATSNNLVSIDTIRHPKLTDLVVHRNKISQIDANALKKNLTKLKELSIGNNPMNLEYVNELKKALEGIVISGYFGQSFDD